MYDFKIISIVNSNVINIVYPSILSKIKIIGVTIRLIIPSIILNGIILPKYFGADS